MALDTATVTLDIADLLGGDFRPDRTAVRATTDAEVVIDTAGNQIRLGSGTAALNPDGTAELEVWVPGAGSNPASWQTSIHVSYPDPSTQSGRGTRTFGPFTITGDANLADLVAEMPVQPEYAAEVFTRLDALEANSGVSDALDVLTAQVNGYTNLGNVSGAVTVQPVGTQVMNVTGPTTITIAGGHANGESFTLLIRSGGDDVTWASSIGFDAGDPEGDIISVTFMKVEGYWTSLAGAGGGGGEVVTPVTDPPTQPGAITVDPTPDGYVLTVVAPTVYAGVEWARDGGSYEPSDVGHPLRKTYTGLGAGSSHSGAVRSYNSLGERHPTPVAWGPTSTDSVELHDLILSMEPEVYVRMTEGSIQDYSRVPATWTAYNFYGTPGVVPTDFTGPALTPGDTGSLVPVTGTKVQRTVDGLLEGATALTQMTVSGMKPDATNGGGGTGIYYGGSLAFTGGQTGTESYEAHRPGGVHTWFSVWNPSGFGDNNVHRYIDGNTSSHSVVGGPGAAPLPAPAYPARLFMGGNENGGESMGGYSAYTVIWKRALTESERVALATSAGTLGNPAGGTLT